MPTFKSFDGLSIFFEDDQSSGEALVLLHGVGGNSAGWRDRGWPALSDSGYRVIVPDARGHGRSDRPHDPVADENDAMVRDVVSLLNHIGVETCSVVGHSMGARTVARLVQTDPRVHKAILGGLPRRLLEGTRRDEHPYASALMTEDADSITDPGARFWRLGVDEWGADRLAVAAVFRAEVSALVRIESAQADVLVINGDEDLGAAPVDSVAALFPRSRTLILPGGHGGVWTKPATHQAILDFLAPSSKIKS